MPDQQPSLLEKARLFLQYAYVSEPRWEVLDLFAGEDFRALKQELALLSRAELVERMRRTAFAVFEHAFAGAEGDIVIPLSGGKDSRFILCMALEFGLKERVLAVTWGAPGGLDHDISRKLTKRLGVRHELVSTTEERLSFADLKRAYDNGAHWTDLLLAHFNQAWRRFAPESCAFIGHLGGPAIGSHYAPGDESLDVAGAIEVFESANRKAPGRARMIADIEDRLLDPDLVSFPEQLDLVFRQEGYLRRIIAHERLGARTPLAHPGWLRFGFALPPECRVRYALFSEFTRRAFPHAFDIGMSGAYGSRIDASEVAIRRRRQALRAAQEARNLLRQRGFATFDKYGDARDLARVLTAEEGAPRAYVRAMRRSPGASAAEAASWRRRAMLICNLACESLAAELAAGNERTERACAPSA